MVYGKEPLLPDEDTPEGGYFKDTFVWMWAEGRTAQEIMEELQFDDWNLKRWHVYYFAKKWKLKPRCKKPRN